MSSVDRQRGSAAVELVLVTPALLALLLFVVALGRLADTRAQIDAAARDAARAGTLARGPDSARAAARQAAADRLGDGRVTCRDLDVAVDVSRFRAAGAVTARVTCAVGLRDLALLRLPGRKRLSASFTEVVDTYRGVDDR